MSQEQNKASRTSLASQQSMPGLRQGMLCVEDLRVVAGDGDGFLLSCNLEYSVGGRKLHFGRENVCSNLATLFLATSNTVLALIQYDSEPLWVQPLWVELL